MGKMLTGTLFWRKKSLAMLGYLVAKVVFLRSVRDFIHFAAPTKRREGDDMGSGGVFRFQPFSQRISEPVMPPKTVGNRGLEIISGILAARTMTNSYGESGDPAL